MLTAANNLRQSAARIRPSVMAAMGRQSPVASVVPANSVRAGPDAEWVTIKNQELEWLDGLILPRVVKATISIEKLHIRKTGHLRAVTAAILDEALVIYVSGKRAAIVKKGSWHIRTDLDRTIILANSTTAENIKLTFHHTVDGRSRIENLAPCIPVQGLPGAGCAGQSIIKAASELPLTAGNDLVGVTKTADLDPPDQPVEHDLEKPHIGTPPDEQSIRAGMRALGEAVASALTGINKKRG